ncbi:unnamed protein product, partial [Discosporangium mesarthrocarpum]
GREIRRTGQRSAYWTLGCSPWWPWIWRAPMALGGPVQLQMSPTGGRGGLPEIGGSGSTRLWAALCMRAEAVRWPSRRVDGSLGWPGSPSRRRAGEG